MRGLSSAAHRTLIHRNDDRAVRTVSLSRAALALLIAGLLVAGVAIGSVLAALRPGGPVATPSPSVTATAPASAEPSAGLPSADVDGSDLDRLPRFPGAVRSEYRVQADDLFRLTAIEYLADATLDDVRDFYRRATIEHGWQLADIGYAGGEWTYILVDGPVEALVEIEAADGLIEIDIQLSEPMPTPQPTPTQRPPAAPPPPPPGGGDGDDGDDDDDDASDDGSDDGESDG